MITLFTELFIKFFFLFTPFFLLSSFLSLTSGLDNRTKQKIALKSGIATAVICVTLFFLGNQIFSLFGITLDSFRVGTGILLFFSALSLVKGTSNEKGGEGETDISVVPLSMPITVGPATTGTLLILGGELEGVKSNLIAMAAIFGAVLCITVFMLLSGYIKRIIKDQGISILSKITGLILAALAAQLVMTGVRNFF